MKLAQRILAAVFSLVLVCFSLVTAPVPAAWADSDPFMEKLQDLMKGVKVTDGGFSVTTPPLKVEQRIIVEKAIVSFNPETIKQGTVDSLKISGTDGTVFYNCENLKVKKNTDLIKSCGGPANLTPNNTVIYAASGSGFGPEQNGEFTVDLKFITDPS